MRACFRLILLISLLSGFLSGSVLAEEEPPKPDVDLPFPVGEKLTYSIYWGWVNVGESVASTGWRLVEGEWKIFIRFRTQSNGVISSIYPVDDTIETVLDPRTMRPETFEVKIREGKTERDEMTVFDWDKKIAYWTKFHDDKDDEKKEVLLEANTRDLVSFMYFMRDTTFEKGTQYEFQVLTDAKIYELFVESGKTKKIKLATYGKIKSLQLNPTASFEGIFVRKGKVKVWLSEDDRQILTKLLLDTPFANVRMLLEQVDGPGEDHWVQDSADTK